MRISVVLFCLLCTPAFGVMVESTPGSFAGAFSLPFAVSTSDSGPGPEVLIPIQNANSFHGMLDTDRNLITINQPITTDAMSINRILLATIGSGFSEVCDLNGCAPAQPVTAPFKIDVVIDAVDFDFVGSASVFGVQKSIAFTSPVTAASTPTVTGTWTITGPTETASGSFSQRTELLSKVQQFGFHRTPISGQVSNWQLPSGVLQFRNDTQSATMSSVVVDGVTFQVTSVPEPAAAVLLGLVGAIAFVWQRIKKRSE